MPRIKIIRAALREIQKLPYSACEKVYEIIRSLSQEIHTDTRLVEKYSNLRLLRTKKGTVRVIWKKDDNNDILIIKAAERNDAYRSNLVDRNFDNQELVTELDCLEELRLIETDFSEHPAYRWNDDLNLDWYQFVFNSYRYFPVKTSYQKEFLEPVLKSLNTYRYSERKEELNNQTCIIQSAPGTGKTVCTTLFACEIHRENQWNIMMIVPDALKKDIAKYSEVQQALMQDNFYLLTFREWLHQVNSEYENILASPEEELAALRKAVQCSPNLNNLNLNDIVYRDVLLYQCFLLDIENQNQTRNAIFKENESQLQKLAKIDKNIWLRALSGKKSRLDIAIELKENPSLANLKSGNTLVIIDEAQDLMLCELQAIITTCEEWNRKQSLTHLWLLGDLNQRIQPTDFNWGQLHLGKPISLKRNYRNSRHILEFANQFLYLAENINRKFKGQHLPVSVNPEDAFEVGEKVRFLKCDSRDDTLFFLQQLASECESGENKRYLLHDLANSIKVITNQKLDIDDENLIILNAEDAKGREFEACVACGLFSGNNEPSLEEAFQWYTLLTRARSRLLIVVTPEELKRLDLNLNKYDYFENCLEIDIYSAINWITCLASDVDISKITNVKQRLLKRCESGKFYWDTYLALQLAGIEGDELYQWEKDAISLLKKYKNEYLKSELNHIQNISLRCLLWRTMEFSWQAVIEASKLEKIDVKEYERLINSIAEDLENKGFIYEAARIKARISKDKTHLTFPFWQEISEKSHSSQPLIELLCEAFASRIENIFEQEDIKK